MVYRCLIAILVLPLLALPAHAKPREREHFEIAVDNALKYLAQAQNADGSWTAGMRFGGGGNEAAVAGLCVMSFLSAGHVPGEGPYGGVIEKGIRYVCAQQQRNGLIGNTGGGMTMMYTHGICTLMLAEVVGLMPDRREADALRGRLVAAVQLIKTAQCRRLGEQGWRYQIQPQNSDMSVTGWQIMALRAAKNVGCDVPNDVVDRAVEYINNSRDRHTGGYQYTRGANTTVPCTGAAVLALELTTKDYHGSRESIDAAQYMTDMLSNNNQGGFRGGFALNQHFFYGVYYTSQAMFQVGGKYWNWYRGYLHSLLFDGGAGSNSQRPGGFWDGVSGDDRMAGTNYCTAMAVLSLTVEYRFLPIYQRGEEPEEREK
jgi:hypothetical protein